MDTPTITYTYLCSVCGAATTKSLPITEEVKNVEKFKAALQTGVADDRLCPRCRLVETVREYLAALELPDYSQTKKEVNNLENGQTYCLSGGEEFLVNDGISRFVIAKANSAIRITQIKLALAGIHRNLEEIANADNLAKQITSEQQRG